MLEIKGKVSTAICYAKVIETEAIDQIRIPDEVLAAVRINGLQL